MAVLIVSQERLMIMPLAGVLQAGQQAKKTAQVKYVALYWTKKNVHDLKILWDAGLTASECAKILGGLTRNQVIGKIHRLAFPSDPLSGQASTRTRNRVDPQHGWQHVHDKALSVAFDRGVELSEIRKIFEHFIDRV